LHKTHHNIKTEIKDYLKSTYDQFYNEKMAEQNAKIKKATENYDYKHNSIAQMEADKHADYANTSNNHKAIAAEKNR